MALLVTGSSGFVGQHVIREFTLGGYDGLLGPSSQQLDLLGSKASILAYLLEHHVEGVIHLAGHVGGIGLNKDRPAELAYNNLLMGMNLIECARQANVDRFVLIGTTCSYPHTPKTIPFVEDELFDGMPELTNAGYGICKRTLIKLLQVYREQYGLNGISLIPTNMVGEYDHFDLHNSHVCPVLIRKFDEAVQRGENEVTLWGDGSPSRDWIYAGDCAEAIRLAYELYDGAEPVNIGTGVEVSIKEVADIIATAVGYTGKIIWDTSKPNGQPRRSLDVSRARERFEFEATTDLKTAIGRTVSWYREHVRS